MILCLGSLFGSGSWLASGDDEGDGGGGGGDIPI